MIQIETTAAFQKWLKGLKDRRARIRIQARIDRLEQGNPGQVAPVGEGISELKISYGPGYRIYYVQRSSVIVILLHGGDKSSQKSDIKKAKLIAKQLGEA